MKKGKSKIKKASVSTTFGDTVKTGDTVKVSGSRLKRNDGVFNIAKITRKPIEFGVNSYGLGEMTLSDYGHKRRMDNRKFKGKHPACKACSGCGKGNPCPIL
jgi:hypothetical protein